MTQQVYKITVLLRFCRIERGGDLAATVAIYCGCIRKLKSFGKFFLTVNNSSNLVSFYYRTEPSSSGGNNHDRLSDLKIIDQMLKTYDRRATPTNKIGEPTRVECELFIRSFGSISEKTMVRIKNIYYLFCGLSVPFFKDKG